MRSLAALAFFLTVCTLVPHGHAAAQTFGTATLSIVVSPQYPRPYETVVITPRSTALNLAASSVTVTANGAVVEQGSGERSVSVVMGGPGSSTIVRVTATQGGASESAEITLRPADVALVVEPLTTGHPFFDGGLLVAPEGRVRLVAMTDFRSSAGTRIAPNTLSYTWRVGNRILTEESGVGRSTLIASAPVRYRNADVSVTVSTVNDSMTGYAAAEIAPANPKAYAYRIDPLLGIDFAHALSGTVPLVGEEDSFAVVPFYFKEDPNLAWTINGVAAGADQTLTVRTQNATAGTASIGVMASDVSGESASASFGVSFKGSSSGVFGF